MGKQNIKALLGLLLLAFLIGLGVIGYAAIDPSVTYSIEYNLVTNAEYYPSLTAEHESRRLTEAE